MRKFYNLMMALLLTATGLSATAATPKPNKLSPPTGRETIVEDQPEGKLTLLSRTCRGFQEFMGTTEQVIEEGSIVKMVEQADGTVWLGNIISRYPVPGWVKAEKEDDLLIIKGPQLVYQEFDLEGGSNQWINTYVSAVEIQHYTNADGVEMIHYEPTADGIFTFRIDGDRIIEYYEDPEDERYNGSLILGLVNYNKVHNYFFTGYGDNYIMMDVPQEKPAVVPATAEIHEKWAMQYDYYDFSTYESMKSAKFVDVAIDGDDYYIRGIYPSIPDAWVKGTLQGNSIIFPNFQMIGPNLEYNYFVYLCGGQMLVSDEGWHEAVIDPEGFALTLEKDGTLTAETNIIFATSPNTDPDDANLIDYFGAVEIHPQDPDSFSAPVAPDDMYVGGMDGDIALEFGIAALDVDGNILNEDDYYFSIYVNDELFTFSQEWYPELKDLGIDGSTTELPYNIGNYGRAFYQERNWHTVYIFGMPTEEIKTIGLQSIYYPEGKAVNPDNYIAGKIYFVDVKGSNSIDSIEDGEAVRIEYFDMQGRKVMSPSNGIYIKTVTYSDGSVKTSKVALKK